MCTEFSLNAMSKRWRKHSLPPDPDVVVPNESSSDPSPVLPSTVVLQGDPRCILHLPTVSLATWIRTAVSEASGQIRSKVDELFGNMGVASVELHAPGMQLTKEFGQLEKGNAVGHVGVTVNFVDGREPLRHAQLYSTMGGHIVLTQRHPGSAAAILMDAMERTRNLLQSGL